MLIDQSATWSTQTRH